MWYFKGILAESKMLYISLTKIPGPYEMEINLGGRKVYIIAVIPVIFL